MASNFLISTRHVASCKLVEVIIFIPGSFPFILIVDRPNQTHPRTQNMKRDADTLLRIWSSTLSEHLSFFGVIMSSRESKCPGLPVLVDVLVTCNRQRKMLLALTSYPLISERDVDRLRETLEGFMSSLEQHAFECPHKRQ